MRLREFTVSLLGIIVFVGITASQAVAGACSDSSQESAYSTCVINEGFLACEAVNASCNYYEYYLNPHDPVSVMIDLCCGLPTDDARRSCFVKNRKRVTKGPFPSRFKLEVKTIVNNYIADPEVFCTEH